MDASAENVNGGKDFSFQSEFLELKFEETEDPSSLESLQTIATETCLSPSTIYKWFHFRRTGTPTGNLDREKDFNFQSEFLELEFQKAHDPDSLERLQSIATEIDLSLHTVFKWFQFRRRILEKKVALGKTEQEMANAPPNIGSLPGLTDSSTRPEATDSITELMKSWVPENLLCPNDYIEMGSLASSKDLSVLSQQTLTVLDPMESSAARARLASSAPESFGSGQETLPKKKPRLSTGGDYSCFEHGCNYSGLKRKGWLDHHERSHFPRKIFICGREECGNEIIWRTENAKNHLRSKHEAKDSTLIDSEVDRRTVQVRDFFHTQCGFCDQKLDKWEDSVKHILDHIEKGIKNGLAVTGWNHHCGQHVLTPGVHYDFPRDEADQTSNAHSYPEDGNSGGSGAGGSGLSSLDQNQGHGAFGSTSFDMNITLGMEHPEDLNFTYLSRDIRLTKLLGSGSSGKVYEARHKTSGSLFALKTIQCHKPRTITKVSESWVLLEIEIMRWLHHHHIVQFLDSFLTSDGYAILMQPKAHGTLRQLLCAPKLFLSQMISSQESLTQFLLTSMACVASALHYLHSGLDRAGVRIYHMDLKPENILIANGKLHLADFGSARFEAFADRQEPERFQTYQGVYTITRKYAAPEIQPKSTKDEARVPSSAADMWSFGCIVSQVLAFAEYGTPNSQSVGTFYSAGQGDSSYAGMLESTREWLRKLQCQAYSKEHSKSYQAMVGTCRDLLSEDPQDRPSAHDVWLRLPKRDCCRDTNQRVNNRMASSLELLSPTDQKRKGSKAVVKTVIDILNSHALQYSPTTETVIIADCGDGILSYTSCQMLPTAIPRSLSRVATANPTSRDAEHLRYSEKPAFTNSIDDTVGLICASPRDSTKEKAMLDKMCLKSITQPKNYGNCCTLGSFGEHNTVTTCIPDGIGSSAIDAKSMESTLFNLMLDVSVAIRQVMQHGITHRDIRTVNVLKFSETTGGSETDCLEYGKKLPILLENTIARLEATAQYRGRKLSGLVAGALGGRAVPGEKQTYHSIDPIDGLATCYPCGRGSKMREKLRIRLKIPCSASASHRSNVESVKEPRDDEVCFEMQATCTRKNSLYPWSHLILQDMSETWNSDTPHKNSKWQEQALASAIYTSHLSVEAFSHAVGNFKTFGTVYKHATRELEEDSPTPSSNDLFNLELYESRNIWASSPIQDLEGPCTQQRYIISVLQEGPVCFNSEQCSTDLTCDQELPEGRRGYTIDKEGRERQRKQGESTLALDETQRLKDYINVCHRTTQFPQTLTDLKHNHHIPDNDTKVGGKGKGFTFLLHGSPGVGKTATAECIAKLSQKPLFPFTCDHSMFDAGDEILPERLVQRSRGDVNYRSIFENPQLLLDEVDDFLQPKFDVRYKLTNRILDLSTSIPRIQRDGMTPLMLALSSRNAHQVHSLLAAGSDRCYSRRSPLHVAALRVGITPLMLALSSCHVHQVHLLRAAGSNPCYRVYADALERLESQQSQHSNSTTGFWLWPALVQSCFFMTKLQHAFAGGLGGSMLYFEKVLGIHDSVSTYGGLSTLNEQYSKAHFIHRSVKELLLNQATIADPIIATALHLCKPIFERQQLDYRVLSLCRNASISNSMKGTQGPAYFGLERLVAMLPENGYDPESKEDDQRAVLSLIATIGKDATARLLIDQGENAYTQETCESMLFWWAASRGYEKLIELLSQEGVEIDAEFYGQTALSKAAEMGHEAVVRSLLEKTTNLDARDHKDWTPLYLAARTGHKTVFELLLSSGARIEVKDQASRTLLELISYLRREALSEATADNRTDLHAKFANTQTKQLRGEVTTGHTTGTKLSLRKAARRPPKVYDDSVVDGCKEDV